MSVGANRLRAGALASMLVVATALLASQPRTAGGASTRRPTPAATVSPVLQPYARQAAACPGLDPVLLVAIHDVETQRDAEGATSSAGAVGPMQFLPSTWAAYGRDGDGDGTVTPWDIDDALAGATNLLCADGAADPAQQASAIWNYNHSWDYVQAVIDRAAQLHRELS